jgi:hypothetical protein
LPVIRFFLLLPKFIDAVDTSLIATTLFSPVLFSSIMLLSFQVEHVHAALLILRQLLLHPGAFMKREASGYTEELYEQHVQ